MTKGSESLQNLGCMNTVAEGLSEIPRARFATALATSGLAASTSSSEGGGKLSARSR